MPIHYSEQNLETIMRHFAEGFDKPKGEEVLSVEWLVDTSKGKVMFTVITRPAQQCPAFYEPNPETKCQRCERPEGHLGAHQSPSGTQWTTDSEPVGDLPNGKFSQRAVDEGCGP